MIRKIIKQGNKSYTFTLPISWIKENNLKGSDEIETNADGQYLILCPKKGIQESDKETFFDLANFGERVIRNILNQSYRQGYDKIRLEFHSPEQLKIVREITEDSLLGFAIVEEKGKHCMLQNIAEPAKERYDIILRKVFLTIKMEAEDILEEFRKAAPKDIEKRIRQKNTVDKYNNYLRRVIISNKAGGAGKSHLQYHLVSLLSMIHHAYYYLVLAAKDMKVGHLEKDVDKLFSSTNSLLDDLYETYYKDPNIDFEVGRKKIKLFTETIYPLINSSSKQRVIVYHLAEVIRLVQQCSSVVYGISVGEKVKP